MLDAIGTGVNEVLGWAGQVVSALTNTDAGAWRALLPLFGVGVAVSAVMLGVKIVKGFTWGA